MRWRILRAGPRSADTTAPLARMRASTDAGIFGLSIAFAASSFFLSFFSFGGGALIS